MRNIIRKTATASLLFGLTAGLSVVVAPAAGADHGEQPTVRQLMEDCGTKSARDKCIFHASNVRKYLTPEVRVSETVPNCSSQNATHTVNGSRTYGTNKTWQVGVEVGVEIFEVWKVGVSASYGETLVNLKTVGSSTAVTIPKHHIGWIGQRVEMVESTGTFELHYPHRKWGHYYWYVNNQKAASPVESNAGTITIPHTRAMTSAERTRYCGH